MAPESDLQNRPCHGCCVHAVVEVSRRIACIASSLTTASGHISLISFGQAPQHSSSTYTTFGCTPLSTNCNSICLVPAGSHVVVRPEHRIRCRPSMTLKTHSRLHLFAASRVQSSTRTSSPCSAPSSLATSASRAFASVIYKFLTHFAEIW